MKRTVIYHQTSAEYLKSRLIDFFIQQFNNIFIGNEVMYGIKRKVVDLLIIKNNQLIAIEIKGDNDDLRKLQEQINECKKIFDYIIVCTTKTHLEKLNQIISDDIGIYLITENSIKKIKTPQKQNKQSKIDILYTMNSKYLKTELNINKKLNSDEIRELVAKKNMNYIHKLLCQYFSLRIKEKYQLFLSDRGIITHIDDIPILSSNIEIQ